MNKTKIIKLELNIIIITVVFILLFTMSGLFISPLTAHQYSERSLHYGPSEIVYSRDYEQGKYYLCRYDQWISVDTINKQKLFFWNLGNMNIIPKNRQDNPISYSWSSTKEYNIVYGSINDDRIKKIEARLTDGSSIIETTFYEDLFLINWKSKNLFKEIIAYDNDDNIIYHNKY